MNKPIVRPDEVWYVTALKAIARHIPPLQGWLRRKVDRLEQEAYDAYIGGDRAAAIAKYRDALEWQPDNADLHGKLGQVYGEVGDYETAERSFHFALILDYQDKHALKGLAVV